MMSQILYFFSIHFKNQNIVCLSCLHLLKNETAQVIFQDASNYLSSLVVMSIKLMYTHICAAHTWTHSPRLTHSLYLLTARNLLHQKVLWHIEVIFLEISCFARNFFFLYFQTPESYIFLNYKRAESVLKLFKQHGLQNYVLCFIAVNITMVECYGKEKVHLWFCLTSSSIFPQRYYFECYASY